MDEAATSSKQSRDWSVFFSSVFFVLGFSLVFSLVGVLLQTVLSNASYTVQEWLGRVGGVIIILFGFFLLGLFTPAFLKTDHKILVKRRFRSHYLTSFVFGAAFAVGWTPVCFRGFGRDSGACINIGGKRVLALGRLHAWIGDPIPFGWPFHESSADAH